MKYFYIISFVLISMFIFSTSGFACPEGEVSVYSFSSTLFKDWLSRTVDRDKDNCLSQTEINLVTSIDLESVPKTEHTKKLFYGDENLAQEANSETTKAQLALVARDFQSIKFPNLKRIVCFDYLSGIMELDLPGLEYIEQCAEPMGRAPITVKMNLPDLKYIDDSAFTDGLPDTKEVNMPNVEVVGDNTFVLNKTRTLKLPNARIIGRWGLGEDHLERLELTTPKDIILDKKYFKGDDSDTEKIDLVLNKNKSPKGKSSPKVTDNNQWGGHKWKSITYKK